MATSTTLHFVVIYVENIETAAEFFTKTLGFAVPDQDPNEPGFRRFDGGEGVAFGLQQVDSRFPHKAGTVELWLKTDNLPATHARLSEQNAAATPIIPMPFASFFGVRAPDGAAITIQS